MSKSATFGVIIGNRGFFPDILARDGREEILRVLEQQGFGSRLPDSARKPNSDPWKPSRTPTNARTSSASIATKSTASRGAAQFRR